MTSCCGIAVLRQKQQRSERFGGAIGVISASDVAGSSSAEESFVVALLELPLDLLHRVIAFRPLSKG
jgi:hypothetical protein